MRFWDSSAVVPLLVAQGAAAVVLAEHDLSTVEVVCLDDRLTAALRREGFGVIVPA